MHLALGRIDQNLKNQIRIVSSFEELLDYNFHAHVNAICWQRALHGDFEEIIQKIETNENLFQIEPQQLLQLQLSEQGRLARDIVLNDYAVLKTHGASPVINLIKYYERDENEFFPTDVYSFHVDRSPIPGSTFLCTYVGEPSEIIANDEAEQKMMIPDIRLELRKQFKGREEDFENYLSEHFYDLHYQAKHDAKIISLGKGHLWRLAVDCPGSDVLPCIHRAPIEKNEQARLLLIC